MQSDTDHLDPLIDRPPARYVIGIDLGTTNCAVTFTDTNADPWTIEVLPIDQVVSPHETEPLDTLPSFHFQAATSAISADPDSLKLPWDIPGGKPVNFCVGQFARESMLRTSGRGIASAKSWLCHAAVDRTAGLLPWHAAPDVKRLSPVEVSSAYLRHIRKTWDARFADDAMADQDIVITLPASFDEVARELTVRAAADAGLKNVVLIEEPQAAFYAWVYRHQQSWQSLVSVGQKVLICDIGGGTTDLTLIRVRSSSNDAQQGPDAEVQFHRVAVGRHLILGGDNLDLAIAKHLESKIGDGQPLSPAQWDTLAVKSRSVKERMLSGDAPESLTVSVPSASSKLIAGSLETEVTRDEIHTLILEGFLPEVSLSDVPVTAESGFQEFGLPFASDPAITRHLADFLTTHASAGLETKLDPESTAEPNSARPDVILFNGGFFASPLLRARVIDQITGWFDDAQSPSSESAWQPLVLENDRLDLAVSRGATYYGMVRRDLGVRIAASLARSYYIDIGGGEAVCVMPGSAQAGESFVIDDHTFLLTLSQPVEFAIHVSSVRLADVPGQRVSIDPHEMSPLPPIRTVIQTKSRNEKRDVPVRLHSTLTEVGTIDLSLHQVDDERSWRLNFDVRSTTRTDIDAHQSAGESQGVVDESIWLPCQSAIENVFGKKPAGQGGDEARPKKLKPRDLTPTLVEQLELPREQWPMSLLRRMWESLMECESGRRKSTAHESRWLNLLGYCLRPGYGLALDDWRVTETWRHVRGNLVHADANIQTQSLILWRRVAGGLSAGQQSAIAQPLVASLRSVVRQAQGTAGRGGAVSLRPEDAAEVFRLLGSLELLSVTQKLEIGDAMVQLLGRKRFAATVPFIIWALGRIGQRQPVYGPLNTVVPAEEVGGWINLLLKRADADAAVVFAITQMAHRTGDRYRDIDASLRGRVLKFMQQQDADPSLVKLVRDGGTFAADQQSQAFGESLPAGLRLVG